MEIKKTEKASLENKRVLFVEIGFVVALLIVFGAFSYSTKEASVSVMEAENIEVAEEEIIPTTPDTPPPPPEAPKLPDLSDQIDIVDDDIQVDDLKIDTEDDASKGVEILDYQEKVEEVAEIEEEEEVPFFVVEEKPTFNGGDPSTEFNKWVSEHVQYPETAKENGVQGRVVLQFTVGKDGKLTNIRVVRGVDPLLDKEAVRVVSQSPAWTPGKQRGRATKVQFTFPVIFQLR